MLSALPSGETTGVHDPAVGWGTWAHWQCDRGVSAPPLRSTHCKPPPTGHGKGEGGDRPQASPPTPQRIISLFVNSNRKLVF